MCVPRTQYDIGKRKLSCVSLEPSTILERESCHVCPSNPVRYWKEKVAMCVPRTQYDIGKRKLPYVSLQSSFICHSVFKVYTDAMETLNVAEIDAQTTGQRGFVVVS